MIVIEMMDHTHGLTTVVIVVSDMKKQATIVMCVKAVFVPKHVMRPI